MWHASSPPLHKFSSTRASNNCEAPPTEECCYRPWLHRPLLQYCTKQSMTLMMARPASERIALQPRWALDSNSSQAHPRQTVPPLNGMMLLDPAHLLPSDQTTGADLFYAASSSSSSNGSRPLPMRARNLDPRTARSLGFTKQQIPPSSSLAVSSSSEIPFVPLLSGENDTPEDASGSNVLQTPEQNEPIQFCSFPPVIVEESRSTNLQQRCTVVRPTPSLFLPNDF